MRRKGHIYNKKCFRCNSTFQVHTPPGDYWNICFECRKKGKGYNYQDPLDITYFREEKK